MAIVIEATEEKKKPSAWEMRYGAALRRFSNTGEKAPEPVIEQDKDNGEFAQDGKELISEALDSKDIAEKTQFGTALKRNKELESPGVDIPEAEEIASAPAFAQSNNAPMTQEIEEDIENEKIFDNPYVKRPDPKRQKRREERRQKRERQGWPRLTDIFRQQDVWETDPEREARRLIDSRQSGIPLYMMDTGDLAKVAGARRQMAEAFPIYSNLSDSTLRWLQARENLKIARDDAEQLEEINKGLSQLAVSLTPNREWQFIDVFKGTWYDVASGYAGANKYEAASNKNNIKGAIDRFEARAWQGLANRLKPEDYLMPENTVDRFVHDVLRSTGFQISSMAQYLGTSAFVTWLTGNPRLGTMAGNVVSIWSEASFEAGGTYEEALGRGMSEDEAVSYANNDFWKNVLILSVNEPIQNYITFGGKQIFGRIFGVTASSSLFRRALGRLGDFAISGIFEGLEEISQGLAKNSALGDKNNWDELLWEFVVGGGSGFLGSTIGGTARYTASKAMERSARADMAKAKGEIIGKTIEAISGSKTAARIPEAAEDFIRDVTDGKIDKVYIDSEALAEYAQIADLESIEALMEDLGIPEDTQEDFRDAMEIGGDIELDAANLFVKMGTDNEGKYDVLKDHIKLSPTEMSAAEAADSEESIRAAISELEAKADAEIELAKEKLPFVAFSREMKKQFVAAGRADLFGKTGSNAEKAMNLFMARAMRKASDLGVDAKDLIAPGAVQVVSDGHGGVKIQLRREGETSPIELAQSAYHGTPHRGIEKMSLNAIGTGEGAQVYGWGIYSAQNRQVGEEYRRNVSLNHDWNPDEQKIGGKTLSEWIRYLYDFADNRPSKDPQSREAYEKVNLLERFVTAGYDADKVDRHDYSPGVRKWFDDYVKKFKQPGQLYRLEVPESDVLLDWDKPLSEQPEKVRAALKKQFSLESFNEDFATAGDFYNARARKLGSQEAASKELLALGIPGLQYLDGMSRGSGEGTHNFVVWDEGAMEVAETYYQRGSVTPEDNARRGAEAMERVIAEHADVADAMYRDDIGGISFLWGKTGKSGWGVAHLIERRDAQHKEHPELPDGLAVAREMPEVIAKGELNLFQGQNKFSDTARLTYNGYTAILRLYKDRNRQTWLLTGFGDYKNKLSDASGEGVNSSGATISDPTGFRIGEGAESLTENSLPPADEVFKQLDASEETVVTKGSTAFSRDAAVITLFESADMSTFLHEMGHFFLQDVYDVAMTKGASTSAQDLWRGIAEYLEVDDIDLSKPLGEADSNRWKTAHEKFAAAFEQYLFEGKAPTPFLKGAFRAFKKWLTDIYKVIAGVRYRDADGKWHKSEITDEIRGLFDRMLATDEAINYEAAMNDLLNIGPQGSDAETASEAGEEAFEEIIDSGKERLLVRLLEDYTPEQRSRIQRRAEKLLPDVRSDVEKEPVYRAITEMRGDPDLRLSGEEILNGWGDTALANLPEGIDRENGIPVSAAASEYGFAGADEFIDALANAPDMEEEIWRRAVEQAEMTDGETSDKRDDVNMAAESLVEGDELLDRAVRERIAMSDSDAARAAFMEESERAQAERDNPLNRKKLIKFIKENGGLSLKKVKVGYGEFEAADLVNRIGRQAGFWRRPDSARGLDEMASEMAQAGIPVEGDRQLFDLLMSEDVSTLDPYEEAYQKGVADERQKGRAERKEAFLEEKAKKEWLRSYHENFKTNKEKWTQAAQHIIGAKNSRDGVKESSYIREAGKYRRLWDKAMRDKNMDAAARYKDLETLNTACAREAVKTAREEDRIMHFLRKYANRPNKTSFGVAPKYLAQIDAVLARFDLRKKVPAYQQDKEFRVKPLDKFVEDLRNAGEPILIPDRILDANFKTSWTKMTVDELRDLYKTVKNIETLGKNEKKTISGEWHRDIDLAAAEISKKIREYYKIKGPSIVEPSPSARKAQTTLGKLSEMPEEFMASHETAEFITRAMDGYEDLGPAHQLVFQPVRDALSRETRLLNEYYAKLNELVIDIYGTANPGFAETRIELDIPKTTTENTFAGVNEKWSLRRDELISAVLNMGNEGNKQRMRDGYNLSPANMRKMIDALSKQDMDFVQGVWDLLETMRPMVQETAELMTGVTPEWVEAAPVVTKYGTYKGGYYPIVTDIELSQAAAKQEEMSSLMDTISLDYLSGTTKDGHRKERAHNVYGRPPLLSLSVIDRHFINVIHDAALAPAIRDANKIIHHPMVLDAVKQSLGDEKNKTLNHWLRAVAKNNKNNGLALGLGDKFLQWARRGVVMMGLGLNLSGAIKQTFGYFPLASKIGPNRAVRAMLSGLRHPFETKKFALEKSEFMREQILGQDRDLLEIVRKWQRKGGGKLSAFRCFAVSQYAFFQNLCNIPGWVESYKLGLEKYGGDDAKAVKFADSVIRKTQGSGTIADLSRFETSGELQRLFTMFYSWFRVMHNMNVETFRRVKNEKGYTHKLGVFMNHAFFVLMLPALFERLLRDGGPDKDETWPRYLMKNALISAVTSPIEAVPIVRDVARGTESWLKYNGRFGYRFTPLSATVESVTELMGNAALITGDLWEGEEPDWGKVAESAVEASGYAFGLPTRMAKEWWDVLWDSVDGEAEFINEAAKLIFQGKRDKKGKRR
ncbi:MAG: hypothetical protein LBS45_08190 [Synergistaceae bacterium]|jgi:hypothetical protein|nr:hypothetical protein [Synergistaceae bacterium]